MPLDFQSSTRYSVRVANEIYVEFIPNDETENTGHAKCDRNCARRGRFSLLRLPFAGQRANDTARTRRIISRLKFNLKNICCFVTPVHVPTTGFAGAALLFIGKCVERTTHNCDKFQLGIHFEPRPLLHDGLYVKLQQRSRSRVFSLLVNGCDRDQTR